jgi:hypothetical protein
MGGEELRNRRIAGYLTEPEYTRLEAQAMKSRRSVSSMVAVAIAQWLDEHGEQQPA